MNRPNEKFAHLWFAYDEFEQISSNIAVFFHREFGTEFTTGQGYASAGSNKFVYAILPISLLSSIISDTVREVSKGFWNEIGSSLADKLINTDDKSNDELCHLHPEKIEKVK